jgi:hypothetical protein
LSLDRGRDPKATRANRDGHEQDHGNIECAL